MKAPQPAVSVCMPVYNASRYLRECIDSVLSQTFADFEFLIVDDGSDDDSAAIVESYADPRIRLIRREHGYIASLNCLLDEARGRYIARMDADDVMLPDRLRLQFDYMEAHPDVDVLGGAMIVFGRGGDKQMSVVENVSMLEMIDGCMLAHPTVMMRTSTLTAGRFRYREDYAYAEDYALWLDMLRGGCRLRNIPQTVLRYRQSDGQISSVRAEQQQELTAALRDDACRWLIGRTYEELERPVEVEPSDKLLTVVIPFLNEGDEVVNTVRSVRETAGESVEIVIVNDESTDGVDYAAALRPYGVRYHVNKMRLGAALSKERGVRLSPTPWFIIIDAHMRFFTANWFSVLTDELKKDENRLLCCRTVPMVKTVNGAVEREPFDNVNRAAYLTFRSDELSPGIRWLENPDRIPAGLEGSEICAVLGACYATSKSYWQKITGMEGLLHFGCEEACLSLKAWLEGGGCHYVPSVELGHIYKNKAQFYVSSPAFAYNYLAIAEMLFPMSELCRARAAVRHVNPEDFAVASRYVVANRPRLRRVRSRFADAVARRFSRIVDININSAAVQNKCLTAAGELLPEVAHSVTDGAAPQSGGLLDGACGRLLFMLEYLSGAESVSDAEAECVGRLFGRVEETIGNRAGGYSFESGLAGIGWAILYIRRHGLLDDNVEPLLRAIDSTLSEYSPARIADNSFLKGTGGIFCYVVSRLQDAPDAHGFAPDFLDELRLKAETVLTATTDVKTSTFAAQLIRSADSRDFAFEMPRPMDVNSPARFIPKDRSLWKLDGPNILGYAIELAYLKRIANTTQPINIK